MTGTAPHYRRDIVRSAIEQSLTAAGFTPRGGHSPGFVIGAGRRRCDGTTSTFSVACSRPSQWGGFEHTRPELVDRYRIVLEADGWAVELDDVETYTLRVAPTGSGADSALPWDAPELMQCSCHDQAHQMCPDVPHRPHVAGAL